MSTSQPTRTERKKFWTTTRIIFTCAVFALVAAFGLSSCSKTAKVNKPIAGIEMPASVLNAQLKDVDGAPLKLADYNGKVVIINMWATWCGPCRIETPELVALSKEYKSRGVELIGLTTQSNDPSVDKIKDFLRANQVEYRTVYDDGSFAGQLTQLTRARSVIPQSFVVRDGYIIKHFEGFDPRSTPAKLRQAVEQAINDKG
ncbi:MAG: TlpA family protein disulfide reductase [Acidobacteria bacterium]|nr:TlpA family protein disulfide reductase [Acidobacteriota bacterium]